VVTAYYASGQETSYSNEASKTVSSASSGVTVDSSHSGYSPAVIDDGIISAPGGTQSTWASANTTSPHWISISLPSSSQLNFLTAWWAYNNAQAKYMTSQRHKIQNLISTVKSEWQTSHHIVDEDRDHPVSVTRLVYIRAAGPPPEVDRSLHYISPVTLLAP
jgi:hypothetical protein